MILSQCGQQLANNQCSLCLFLDLISPWLSRVLRNCLNILDFWLPECKRRAVFFWEFRDLTLLYNNILKIIHPMPSPLRIRNLRVNDQQRGHPWHYLSAAVQSLSFCHFYVTLHSATCQTQCNDTFSWLVYFGIFQELGVTCHWRFMPSYLIQSLQWNIFWGIFLMSVCLILGFLPRGIGNRSSIFRPRW